jgi:hypothetical protein
MAPKSPRRFRSAVPRASIVNSIINIRRDFAPDGTVIITDSDGNSASGRTVAEALVAFRGGKGGAA